MVTTSVTEKANAEVATAASPAASLATSEKNATSIPEEAISATELEWREWRQQSDLDGAATTVAKSENALATHGIDAMKFGTSLSNTLRRILYPYEYTSYTKMADTIFGTIRSTAEIALYKGGFPCSKEPLCQF